MTKKNILNFQPKETKLETSRPEKQVHWSLSAHSKEFLSRGVQNVPRIFATTWTWNHTAIEGVTGVPTTSIHCCWLCENVSHSCRTAERRGQRRRSPLWVLKGSKRLTRYSREPRWRCDRIVRHVLTGSTDSLPSVIVNEFRQSTCSVLAKLRASSASLEIKRCRIYRRTKSLKTLCGTHPHGGKWSGTCVLLQFVQANSCRLTRCSWWSTRILAYGTSPTIDSRSRSPCTRVRVQLLTEISTRINTVVSVVGRSVWLNKASRARRIMDIIVDEHVLLVAGRPYSGLRNIDCVLLEHWEKGRPTAWSRGTQLKTVLVVVK